jgi:outer membrane protein insertion porin family
MIVGDLPPYEAFPIGGTNSVRGYSEGGVGSGRNYVAGTAELHWPMFKPLEVRYCIDSFSITLCGKSPGNAKRSWLTEGSVP